MALCPKRSLAEDIDKQKPPVGEGFSNFILGYVVHKKNEVERVLAQAESPGGRIVRPSQMAFWGGYHGYFADLDGYHWEVMCWENWRFKEDGSLEVE